MQSCDVSAVIAGPRLLNMQNFNLAWIKMHVARVVIPSHREGKQIAQNMLKVACYHLCVTVCSCTETSRNQQTSDANECSVAAQKTVEEAPAMAVLAAIWRLFINEVKHRKKQLTCTAMPVHGVLSKLQNGRFISIFWRNTAFSLTGAHFWLENPQRELGPVARSMLSVNQRLIPWQRIGFDTA